MHGIRTPGNTIKTTGADVFFRRSGVFFAVAARTQLCAAEHPGNASEVFCWDVRFALPDCVRVILFLFFLCCVEVFACSPPSRAPPRPFCTGKGRAEDEDDDRCAIPGRPAGFTPVFWAPLGLTVPSPDSMGPSLD